MFFVAHSETCGPNPSAAFSKAKGYFVKAVFPALDDLFFVLKPSRWIYHKLMGKFRQDDPDFSILDLKAYYRVYCYVVETIKILPQEPDDNLVSQLFQKVTALDRIHPCKVPVSSA
jgi:hypothetical protein